MVTVALQGDKLYAKQAMAWKVAPQSDMCKVTLLSFWDQDLPVRALISVYVFTVLFFFVGQDRLL